jgi:pyruvate,water dikinase
VAPALRGEFDEALSEARTMSRIRDERGVFNDLWAVGLARRAILAAGRRLQKAGALTDPEHLVEASFAEMKDLLAGNGGVTDDELKARRQWRTTANMADAPPWLGAEPSPPPPTEWFAANLRPGQQAISAALGNVFDPPEAPAGDGIVGKAVSPGIYEGTARLIRGSEDFPRLQKGDVLVTKNTSAAFNLVLPLLGAIVTDRGGVLSHAAIVAREYGIPGVVSTRTATRDIPDGARVRVDGDAGTVQVL